jgi:trans-aconitate methyltransferase
MVCKKGVAMNLKHFIKRALGSGDFQYEKLTEQQFRKLLTERINSVDMEKVKADAVRFIPDGTRLDIWSKTYLTDLAGHLKID